jgi:hypothetical protein
MIPVIDPPIGPGAPRAEVETWLKELEEFRAESINDVEALPYIDMELQRARGWLELAPD